jgi:hypothetical protein
VVVVVMGSWFWAGVGPEEEEEGTDGGEDVDVNGGRESEGGRGDEGMISIHIGTWAV